MTCVLFWEHLDTILAEGDFSLDFYVFGILKNLVTFSSFSVKVVFKSFFFIILALSIFSKFTQVFFVSASCFDAVILAEIVLSGSQFITEFDQIFLSYFNRFDFIVFTFLFHDFASR